MEIPFSTGLMDIVNPKYDSIGASLQNNILQPFIALPQIVCENSKILTPDSMSNLFQDNFVETVSPSELSCLH